MFKRQHEVSGARVERKRRNHGAEKRPEPLGQHRHHHDEHGNEGDAHQQPQIGRGKDQIDEINHDQPPCTGTRPARRICHPLAGSETGPAAEPNGRPMAGLTPFAAIAAPAYRYGIRALNPD